MPSIQCIFIQELRRSLISHNSLAKFAIIPKNRHCLFEEEHLAKRLSSSETVTRVQILHGAVCVHFAIMSTRKLLIQQFSPAIGEQDRLGSLALVRQPEKKEK